MTDKKKQCIAYIAPEIPGLSATFVYNEILQLEKRGYRIVSVSIHKPKDKAVEMQSLSERTCYLYSEGMTGFLLSFINLTLNHPRRLAKGLRWLITDFIHLGIIKKDAWKIIFQFFAACRLSQLLIKQNCDHIHIHFADVPTQVGMYASAITDIPYSVTSHANDIFENGILLKSKATRSRCFATISKYNRDYLITQGVPEEKILIVRCGVSFKPLETLHEKINKNRFRVGSLGRLVEKKGMSTLLHAINSIKQLGFDIEVVIAGDGPLAGELKKITEKLGLQQNVDFIGALPHTGVSTWLRDLDVFVLACQTDSNGDMDGIPVALMEAMSQEVPVVSTRISGIPELITHMETGLLSEPGVAEDLAKQIIKLIQTPDLSAQLAKRGKSYVFSEFGENTNIQRLEHCFNLSC